MVYAYVKNKSSVTVKTPFKMSFVWENCTKNESVGVLDFKDGIGANQEGVVVDKEKG